jgi:hypothetical protein
MAAEMKPVMEGAAETVEVLVEAEAGSTQAEMVPCYPMKQNLLASILRLLVFPYITLLALKHAHLECVHHKLILLPPP